MPGLLNDLTREAAILGASGGLTVTVALVGAGDGVAAVELRARKAAPCDTAEYSRQLSMPELELRGPPAVVSQFLQEARRALFPRTTSLAIQRPDEESAATRSSVAKIGRY
jgi:hypothetical protein